MQKESLLSVDQLAEYLNINRTTIYKFIKEGLPYVQVGNRKRFDRYDVMEWLEKRYDEKNKVEDE